MDYNFHTHTYRCGHAKGKDEEYVLAAIKNNYKIIGFTDHAMFPNLDKEEHMRGDFSELEEYIHSISLLKEKYKKQIMIYIGMECEYFPCYHDYLKDLLEKKQMDYLIFGNHFLKCENKHIFNDPFVYEREDYIDQYALHAINALDSGLFKIFAHPDLVMWSCKKFDERWEKYSRLMCEAAKRNNVYLEINEAGIRKGKISTEEGERYCYPYAPFWKIAKEVGNKIVIGIDAHDPSDFQSLSHSLALEFAKELGLEVETTVKI